MRFMGPIVKLFLPFLFGVCTATLAEWHFHYSVNFGLLFSALVLVVALSVGLLLINKMSAWMAVFTWFLLGWNLFVFALPERSPKHYSHVQTDTYEARFERINFAPERKTKFIRCELQVIAAIHGSLKYPTEGRILAFIDTMMWDNFQTKDVILVKSIPETIRNQGNPGEFNAVLYWKTKGISQQWFLGEGDLTVLQLASRSFDFFDGLRKAFVDQLSKFLKGDTFSVAMGILLGDKSHLNLELKDAFSGAGAMHLLAVSGLHVGIFLVMIQGIFSVFGRRLPKWLKFSLIVGILWLYAGITGFSPSVNRAVTMFSFVALGSVFGKRYNPMDGLFASALLLLVLNPLLLFDLGFQLSYAAMIGIFTFSPILQHAFPISNKWLKFIWSGTCVALAAQLTTFPLTLYYFHQFPNYFLLTNLGLMVVSGVIMALGLGLVVLGSVPMLGVHLAWIFGIVVAALIAFVQWISELPHALTTGLRLELWELALIYVAIGLFLFGLHEKRKALIYFNVTLTFVCIGIQSSRYFVDNQSSEFYILNFNDPAIFWKRGTQADVVVLSNKPDIEKKTDFLKRSLDVYFGLDTRIHHLERKSGMSLKLNESCSISVRPALLQIQVNDSMVNYIFGDYFNESDLIANNPIVAGTWVNTNSLHELYPNEKVWSLKEQGAYVLNIAR